MHGDIHGFTSSSRCYPQIKIYNRSINSKSFQRVNNLFTKKARMWQKFGPHWGQVVVRLNNPPKWSYTTKTSSLFSYIFLYRIQDQVRRKRSCDLPRLDLRSLPIRQISSHHGSDQLDGRSVLSPSAVCVSRRTRRQCSRCARCFSDDGIQAVESHYGASKRCHMGRRAISGFHTRNS